MISLDAVTKENVKEQIQIGQKNPDYPYRVLVIGGSGSGEKNVI